MFYGNTPCAQVLQAGLTTGKQMAGEQVREEV